MADTTKLTKKVKSGSTVAPENFVNPRVSGRRFVKSATFSDALTDKELKIDVDFALSLNWGDTIWIDEDATPESHPFFIDTTAKELQEEWADGWYAVMHKSYLMNGKLQIKVMEIHEHDEARKEDGSTYKSIFTPLDSWRYL